MPHPVVYPGDMKALVNEWAEKYGQAWNAHGKEGLKGLRIANGECARLPQELTGVGWTGRWQRGDRVLDVARTLKPGTVIANFRLIDGKWQYPRGSTANVHGYHAALFMSADSYVGGKPTRIWMFDQWRSGTGKAPSPRRVWLHPDGGKQPCDKADEFYVVLVP